MAYTFSNFGTSTLSSGVNNSTTTWAVVDGSVFPATGNFPVRCESELALCTARSGNNLTVTRGSESTSAVSHASGAAVNEVVSKAVLDALFQPDGIAAGLSGQVLGTAGGTPATPAWIWGSERNLLRNSSFAVCQRQPGTESTDTSYADDTYCTCDGWYVLTQTASIQTSRQAGSGRSRYALRLKQSQATAQRMGIAQIIEAQDCYDLRGEAFRKQIKATSSTSQTIRWALLENTTTDDAATSDVVNSWTNSTFTAGQFFIAGLTVAGTGSQALAANTPATIAVTASVSSSCKNLILFVWTESAAAQNVTLSLEEVGLYQGAEGRLWVPPPIGDELRRCQRYYQRLAGDALASALAFKVAGAWILGPLLTLPVAMRAVPTVASSSPTWTAGATSGNQLGWYNDIGGAYASISGALTFAAATRPDAYLVGFFAGTSFSGANLQHGRIQAGSSMYIELPAEL